MDHRRGGGSKHVSSMDDVKARNEGRETAYDQAQRERTERRRDGGSDGPPSRPTRNSGLPAEADSSSSGEEEPSAAQRAQFAPPRRSNDVLSEGVQNPNAVQRNEMKEGVEITRRQREELDKAAATRRYQELHKAGKTDEAKADLARLAEVKARREKQAAERIAREAAEKEAMEEQKRKQAERDNPKSSALKEAMGVEEKSKSSAEPKEEEKEKVEEKKEEKKKKEEEVSWQAKIADAKDLGKPKNKVTDGTIEACRAEEEDFM